MKERKIKEKKTGMQEGKSKGARKEGKEERARRKEESKYDNINITADTHT